MNVVARLLASPAGRGRQALLAAAVLALVGCGTTVNTNGQSAQQAGADLGTSQPGAAAPGAVPGGAGGTPGAVGGSAVVGGTSSSGHSASATQGAAAGPSGSGAVAPAQRRQPRGPIKVGFLVSDYTKAAAAFKSSGAPDPQQWNQYLVKYYNGHGGLAGRQIAPVYYTIDGAATDYNSANQAACAAFTQDDHVELVLSNLWVNRSLTTCLLAAGVPQFEGTVVAQNTESMLAQTPNLFLPSGMALDRAAGALVSESVRLGVLTTKDKLGILYDSCPYSVRAAKEAAIPTARRLGITVDAVEYSQCGGGFSDAGKFTQDVASAEFRMRQDNVTHVMFLAQGEGGAMTFFGKAADSQKWYPKYLVTSNVLMTSNETGGPAAMPQDQAKNVHGIGWDPSLDSDKALHAPTPQMKACLQHTLAGGGQAPSTVNDTLTMYAACNAVTFADAALRASGGVGGLAALRTAIEHLGTSFVSVTTAGGRTRFGVHRHDGAYLVAPFAWQSDCSCFGYVGPPRPVP